MSAIMSVLSRSLPHESAVGIELAGRFASTIGLVPETWNVFWHIETMADDFSATTAEFNRRQRYYSMTQP